jgi:hypothetical protein
VRLASDTLPTAARDIGVRCTTAFTAQTVAARDLESFILLALQLGDSSQAAAATARWVAAPQRSLTDRDESPVVTQGKRLMTAIQHYLDRDATALPFPTTLAAVRPLVQQLDTLGPPVRQYALDAQAALILARIDDGIRTGRWQPEQALQQILAFWPRSDSTAPTVFPSGNAIVGLLIAAIRARGFVDPHGVQAFYDSLATASTTVAFTDTVGNRFWNQLFRSRYLSVFAKVGQITSPLQGAYWYHAPGLAASTTWPQPGRVSVLIAVDRHLGLNQAAMIRRLAAQYGSQGVSITLATKTHGYWLKDGAHTGPVPPAEEAADDSAYYLGYLHLPVTLMVDSTTFTRDSEHRLRQAAPVQFESAYGGQGGGPIGLGGVRVVLADRTGHLIINDVMKEEAQLAAYLARAVGQ